MFHLHARDNYGDDFTSSTTLTQEYGRMHCWAQAVRSWSWCDAEALGVYCYWGRRYIDNGSLLTCFCLTDFMWLQAIVHSAPEKYDFKTVSSYFANIPQKKMRVLLCPYQGRKLIIHSVFMQWFSPSFIINWYIIVLPSQSQLCLSHLFWCLWVSICQKGKIIICPHALSVLSSTGDSSG